MITPILSVLFGQFQLIYGFDPSSNLIPTRAQVAVAGKHVVRFKPMGGDLVPAVDSKPTFLVYKAEGRLNFLDISGRVRHAQQMEIGDPRYIVQSKSRSLAVLGLGMNFAPGATNWKLLYNDAAVQVFDPRTGRMIVSRPFAKVGIPLFPTRKATVLFIIRSSSAKFELVERDLHFRMISRWIPHRASQYAEKIFTELVNDSLLWRSENEFRYSGIAQNLVLRWPGGDLPVQNNGVIVQINEGTTTVTLIGGGQTKRHSRMTFYKTPNPTRSRSDKTR